MSSDEQYQRYLCSPEWWEKRNAVMDRSSGRCEKCGGVAQSVHHLTYIRKYNERLDDLQALCNLCHDSIHNPSEERAFRAGERLKEVRTQSPMDQYLGMFYRRSYQLDAESFGMAVEYYRADDDVIKALENQENGSATMFDVLMAKTVLVRLHRQLDKSRQNAQKGDT